MTGDNSTQLQTVVFISYASAWTAGVNQLRAAVLALQSRIGAIQGAPRAP